MSSPSPVRSVPLAAALALTVALVSIGLGGATAAASAADPTATSPRSEQVDGVLERVSVDRSVASAASGLPGGPTVADPGSAATLTWIRTEDDRIQVQSGAVAAIPSGARVAANLGPTAQIAAANDLDGRGARRVDAIRVVSTQQTSRAAAGLVPGPHRVTLVLALPPGSRADATTPAALGQRLNTDVSRYWSQQTDGKLSFTVSRAVGWISLAHGCDDVWGLWAEAAAASGHTAGTRRHLVVYVPPSAGCPTGLGTVSSGADAGGEVLVGATLTSLLAHELGHNLGLGHSDALRCAGKADAPHTDTGFGAECEHVPYGDWYDVMGISWDNLGTLSTAQAYRLGALPSSAVRSVNGPARVTLQPVSGRTGVRSLRIQDPAGATYVVEYRPAQGSDAWLTSAANWRNLRPGVLVRRVDPTDPSQTLLLDPTPSAARNDQGDVQVVLTPGHTLTTASGRIGIMVESTSSRGAVLSLRVDGAWPAWLTEPGGRLINGTQVTIGQAPAAWAAAANP